jgi:hypothetical protein
MIRSRWVSLLVVALVLTALPYRSAHAAPIVDVGTSAGRFGTLDLATGVFTPLSTVPNGDVLAGLGFTPSRALIGVGGMSATNAPMYSVNPTTGAFAPIGAATLPAFGGTVGSDGLVYAVDQSANTQLFKYNPGNNSTTTVGTLNLPNGTNGLMAFSPNGTLFTDEFNSGNDILASVNTNTGVATTIGTGMGVPIFSGVFVNGTLYGFSPNGGNPAIFTINTTNGTTSGIPAELITGLSPSEMTGPSGGNGGIYAAAFVAPLGPAATVPEPSTLACGLVGALFAGAAGARRWWTRRFAKG